MPDFDFDPDSLFAELADSPEMGDSSGGETHYYYKIPMYVGVVQGMSAMYLKDYDLAIGVYEDNRFEGWYANEVRMLLIEELSNYDAASKTYPGGRKMYAYNADGSKNQVGEDSCKSDNGFFPRMKYFGQTIKHPVTGQNVVIGGDEKGNILPAEDLARTCLSCPLSKGVTVDGRYRSAPCQERTVWIVYLPPQTFYKPNGKLVRGKMQYDAVAFEGGMARIVGNSLGVQLALKGRDPKRTSSGLTSDGKAFSGILSAFRASSNEVLTSVPLDVLSPAAPNMRGFMGYGNAEVANITRQRLDTHTHAWFSVKPEPFAPQGRPELLGDRSFGSVPVYSVLMYVVENDFGKRPNSANVRCPQFSVLDGTTLDLPAELVPPAAYKTYVGLKTQFRLDNRKEEMLGLRPSDEDRLHRLPASQLAPQLPKGKSVVSEAIEEVATNLDEIQF